jgi:hypothetical protein
MQLQTLERVEKDQPQNLRAIRERWRKMANKSLTDKGKTRYTVPFASGPKKIAMPRCRPKAEFRGGCRVELETKEESADRW